MTRCFLGFATPPPSGRVLTVSLARWPSIDGKVELHIFGYRLNER